MATLAPATKTQRLRLFLIVFVLQFAIKKTRHQKISGEKFVGEKLNWS